MAAKRKNAVQKRATKKAAPISAVKPKWRPRRKKWGKQEPKPMDSDLLEITGELMVWFHKDTAPDKTGIYEALYEYISGVKIMIQDNFGVVPKAFSASVSPLSVQKPRLAKNVTDAYERCAAECDALAGRHPAKNVREILQGLGRQFRLFKYGA